MKDKNSSTVPADQTDQPKLTFEKHFANLPPVSWTTKDVLIEENGKIIHDYKNIEVPTTWSNNATNILAIKYLRKAGIRPRTIHGGVDTNSDGREHSLKQVIHRIVRTITNEGMERGYFDKENGEIFADELAALIVHQYGAFNSPVWFNCGLYHQYGIEGSGGSWAWSDEWNNPTEVVNAYQRPQCSACFILSVEDSLDSIFESVKIESRIFKYGSGAGTNFSKLRSRHESLSNGGNSSGVMSFLKVFDVGAGATKSGGTTRRAAKMVCLDVDHPEIMDFIKWKSKEELKVKALVAAGYESNFNGEAYQTVSGQNANNSVRLSDEFMKAYEEDADWVTYTRKDHAKCEIFKARDIMRAISEAAWACADPGLQFDTTINTWHTCPETDRIYASNPCSEFMFLDDTACNLASLNLVKFLDVDAEYQFDLTSFMNAVRVFSVAQEILVDLASYPTRELAQNSHNFRPLGLGYANLGAFLMRKGLPYDSREGRAWAGAITSLMTGHAYFISALMADTKGAFAGYEVNKQSMLSVLDAHKKATTEFENSVPPYLAKAAKECWDDAIGVGERTGFRNAQMTVLAPTGTIGFVMDCDTTGIEPDFALVKHKLLAGRGYMKIVNQSVEPVLCNLNYSDDHISDILAWIDKHETIEGAPHLKHHDLPIFDCANVCGDGDRFIAPMGHIKMLAAVQPFISGSISKTVNVPESTTVEEIEGLNVEAWKQGLKCVAIYRDNCKESQPLSAKKVDPAPVEIPLEDQFGQRRKLPKERHGLTTEAKIAGHKIFIRTGEYDDGSLGELFLDMYKTGASFGGMLNSYARAISIGLQHGVSLEKYVDMYTFSKFEPAGFTTHDDIKMCTSILDFVFRWLALTYLGDMSMVHMNGNGAFEVGPPEKNGGSAKPSDLASVDKLKPTGENCIECQGPLLRSGNCMVCQQCGTTTGCS